MKGNTNYVLRSILPALYSASDEQESCMCFQPDLDETPTPPQPKCEMCQYVTGDDGIEYNNIIFCTISYTPLDLTSPDV